MYPQTQIRNHRAFGLSFFIALLLFGMATYGQTSGNQTKEEKKLAEQEKKNREKQAKEDEKRQKVLDKSRSLLEKLVPIGKNVQYDRFKDTTTVNTNGMTVYPMDRDARFEIAYVGMWSMYSVQGQFGGLPPTVRLFVHGQTLLIGTPSNPCSLSMILNSSERVQFGQMQYGRTIQLGNVAWVDMSLNSFRAIALAKSVDVQTCRFETALNSRHILGLAALLEGLPAAENNSSEIQQPSSVGPLHPLVGLWKFQVTRNNVPEDWTLRVDKNGTALTAQVKMPNGEITLSNIISAGNIFSGSASEIVPGGLNMMIFSGQTSDNSMDGKLTIYLAGQQQPIVAFNARRVSIP